MRGGRTKIGAADNADPAEAGVTIAGSTLDQAAARGAMTGEIETDRMRDRGAMTGGAL